MFAGANYVLSVRNSSTQGFLGVRERCEREPALLRQGSSFVLYALMDAVVDRYFPRSKIWSSMVSSSDSSASTSGK